MQTIKRTDAGAAVDLKIDDFNIDIAAAITAAFAGDERKSGERVTQVYWPADEIFKKAKEKTATSEESEAGAEEPDEESSETADE